MFLRDVGEILEEQITPQALPLLVRARGPATPDGLVALINAEREHLCALRLRHGALLFRGFGVAEAGELQRLLAAARETGMRYFAGISPRRSVGGDVYTSTELPPGVTIPLHSELSYLNEYPNHVWFACVRPAEAGGETILADARKVHDRIDSAVRRRFIDLGVRYRFTFHGESRFFSFIERFQNVTKSWMDAFETADRRTAEARGRELGLQASWLPSGRLVLEIVRPAVLPHPETGEPAWFNSAHLFRLNRRYLGWLRYSLSRLFFLRRETRTHDAFYGDGAPIGLDTLAHLFDAFDAQTVAVPWQRGDVLWIDNRLCMHGRNPFRGRRRVLAALSR
jgi:alpha-ketoglutarate-dependent taurine dioxygenase